MSGVTVDLSEKLSSTKLLIKGTAESKGESEFNSVSICAKYQSEKKLRK